MSAVDDVVAYIGPSGQNLAGGTTGWDLIRRKMGDDPIKDQVVVVAEDGGPLPEIHAVSGIGDAAVKDLGVLITVRAVQWDGDASKAKAAAVLAALHGQRNVTLGSTVYYRVRAMTPEPVFAGFDDTGRPRHTVAFRLLTVAT